MKSAESPSGFHGAKRKASTSGISADVLALETKTPRMQTPLYRLATDLRHRLREAVADDIIVRCGQAPLSIIETHPQEVLDLASTKIHSFPYHAVPACWRRLYEEASIYLVAAIFESRFESPEPFERIVRILDLAVIISGAPSRRMLIDEILLNLSKWIINDPQMSIPRLLTTSLPLDLQTVHPVVRKDHYLDIYEFQDHVGNSPVPIIIPYVMERWPALERWQDISYLMRSTLGGRRLVPIEVGSSYVDECWTQRIVTFSEFANEYLLTEQPCEVGYLAQHDLFTQIPSLRNDVQVPDYCFSLPPVPTGAAARTPGLACGHTEEPLMNAWLGPKGTKTPLHTDPFHNILCQVVGYKYIRLYPPEETSKLYPQTVDEAGINMDNTSQVDVQSFRPKLEFAIASARDEEALQKKFPLFESATYQEAILGPGECMYIPLGWWHYLESLTPSFSVSFWWR